MKKAVSLLCIAVMLCLLCAGCMTSRPFDCDGQFTAFRSDMIARHSFLRSLSLSLTSGGQLDMNCALSSSASRAEVLAVYADLQAFLTRENVLNAYFRKIDAGFEAAAPSEPVISTQPGPKVYLHFTARGMHYPAIEMGFTQFAYTENGGVYIYDGSWSWPKLLRFHQESLTQQVGCGPAGLEPAYMETADFDGDGAEEELLLTGSGENAGLCLVERREDGPVLRQLLNEELTELMAGHSGITVFSDSEWSLYLPGTDMELPVPQARIAACGTPEELQLRVQLHHFEIRDLTILAHLEFSIDGPDQGQSTPLAAAAIPLYYDDELGFRAGAPL